MLKGTMRFLYISTGDSLPPDKHLVDGLRESGHEVLEMSAPDEGPSKYIRFAWHFARNGSRPRAIIVGYGLPLIVPIVRCLTHRKVVFNAISSQYEANIISRGTSGPWSPAALKWMAVDLLSFHFSSFVLLESRAQIAYVRARFFITGKRKLVLARMGVDESVFFRDDHVEKSRDFTVLFRGRFLPESGILIVIAAAKKLENANIRFLIIGHGFLYREVHALMHELRPTNIELIEETLPAEELRKRMLSCRLSLGQLADHPRLLRTLPAKLYESLALGLPYLTGRNAAVFELLTENETCAAVEPGNPDALAEKILSLKRDEKLLRRITEHGYRLYKERLTSRKLAEEFVAACFKR